MVPDDSEAAAAAAWNPTLKMENIEESFPFCRPVKLHTPGGRELHWEYTHPAFGDECMYLTDPATNVVPGDANDHYLALHQEMPEAVVVVEELAVTGTAGQMLLADLVHNDLTRYCSTGAGGSRVLEVSGT